MESSSEQLLNRIGRDIKNVRAQFWTAGDIAPVSYPGEAHAALAKIEESSFWFRHRNKIIGGAVERHSKGKTFFEIGAGNGYVSLGLKRRGISTVVIEPGIDGANVASMRGLTVVNASFSPTLFAPASLPAIGLFDVIEHVADDQNFLLDCENAIEPGGFLYITVPAHRALWSVDDEYAGHYRRYSKSQLVKVVESAGFDVVQVTGFFSILVVPLFLLRTIPSKLSWRNVASASDAFTHHAEGLGSRLIESILRFEIPSIAAGYTLPFGTSLLAVARKRCR